MLGARGVPGLHALARLLATVRAASWPRRVLAFASSFKTSPRRALLVGASCLAGVVYGVFYYAPQLAVTPLPLWPFAPDTPLAVLWALLALGNHWVQRRGGEGERPGLLAATVEAAAFVGNLQVGVWAVVVLLAFRSSFSAPGQSPWLLLVLSHVGMVLLAFVFVDGLRARRSASPRAQAGGLALVTGFYLVQDALDYYGPDFVGRGCGLRPHTIPCDPGAEPLLAALAFGLTIVSALALLALTRSGPTSPSAS